jgi:flagellar basal-body rod protein FlgF
MPGQITSPARAGEVETRSAEGEGDRVAELYLLCADPITLTLDASHLDLSRCARERFCGTGLAPARRMDIASSVATSRLVAQQRALDVIADNLANANTPGYKAARVQFSDWLSRQSGGATPPGGNLIAYAQDRATWREQQAGTITHTGNTLDVALTGDGYFTVNTPAGPRLTRDGRFSLLPSGTLSDTAGNAVLDSTGQPIQLAPTDTQISIAGDGTVSSQNGQIGKIGVVQPSDRMLLSAQGGTLFLSGSTTAPVASPALEQGAIEESNVQPVLEMTRMMDGERQFEFLAQFVQAESDRQQNSIDKLLPQQSA